jgi:hypothetical protein
LFFERADRYNTILQVIQADMRTCMARVGPGANVIQIASISMNTSSMLIA